MRDHCRRADGRPPFEQVREQLADLIRAGELAAGTRLPSIRQLAGDLRIAPGTVARAYAELERADLIMIGRSGAKVSDGQAVDSDVRSAATYFIEAARAKSLTMEDALGAIRASWNAQTGETVS